MSEGRDAADSSMVSVRPSYHRISNAVMENQGDYSLFFFLSEYTIDPTEFINFNAFQHSFSLYTHTKMNAPIPSVPTTRLQELTQQIEGAVFIGYDSFCAECVDLI